MLNYFVEKKHLIIFIFLLCVCFTLITLSIRSRAMLEPVEKTIFYFIGPILKVSAAPKSWGMKIWKNYFYIQDHRKENIKLKKELAELKEIEKSFWELKSEIARLHEILKIKKGKDYKYYFSRVIGKEKNVLLKTVTIDKGSTDKISKNMLAINSHGLVGRILHSNPFTSRVLLITDPRSPVHVRVQRTRSQGIFSMVTMDKGTVKFVSKDADILPGDLLVSTGHGGVFPKGIRVGYVTNIKKGSSFKKIEARPSVNFNKLEELAIMEETKRN